MFIERLEMGPAAYLGLEAHGITASDIDVRLTGLYYNNGLQPYWIKNGEPGKDATDILAVLKEAKSHGLDPNSYFVDKIQEYLDSKDTTGLVRHQT